MRSTRLGVLFPRHARSRSPRPTLLGVASAALAACPAPADYGRMLHRDQCVVLLNRFRKSNRERELDRVESRWDGRAVYTQRILCDTQRTRREASTPPAPSKSVPKISVGRWSYKAKNGLGLGDTWYGETVFTR